MTEILTQLFYRLHDINFFATVKQFLTQTFFFILILSSYLLHSLLTNELQSDNTKPL